MLQAVELVETGKVYELGHIYEPGMPVLPGGTHSLYIPSFRTGGPLGHDLVYNPELVFGEIGQQGTQFDGPATSRSGSPRRTARSNTSSTTECAAAR